MKMFKSIEISANVFKVAGDFKFLYDSAFILSSILRKWMKTWTLSGQLVLHLLRLILLLGMRHIRYRRELRLRKWDTLILKPLVLSRDLNWVDFWNLDIFLLFFRFLRMLL